uniref:Replication enhancer n=1 Tax=Tomato leaf curl New Delhi virus TaxID=223347 RepID=A0A240FBE5_9GEMI|nr:C3 [Pea leaf distortion virus]
MDLRTGETITAAPSMEWPPISGRFQIPSISRSQPRQPSIHDEHGHHQDQDPIQLQLRRALGVHKCFLTYRIWTTLHPRTGLFLKVFKTQVLKYLKNLGVISINSIIRAVDHVLWKKIEQTMYVDMNSEIKFDLY